MKKTLMTAALFAAISASASVQAGGFLGTIGQITVQQPNFVFVSMGGHNNAPSCQGGSDEFALDISTTVGKSQYALLLTAKALESQIQIIGTNNCNLWPDRESVNYLFTTD